MAKPPKTSTFSTNTAKNKKMAIHSVPDSDKVYMQETHGTKYLITDPRSDSLLLKAHREQVAKRKDKKLILDAWTI
jgi:hypothetical protein